MQLLRDAVSRLTVEVRGNEAGQTLVEYGLILALIAVVAIAIMAVVGGDIAAVFQKVSNNLS